MHKTLPVRIGFLSKSLQTIEELSSMVTSLDKTKASSALSEAIGPDNTKSWYREFLYSDMETSQEIKESVKSYAKGVSTSMGWRNPLNPQIPSDDIPRLVVESLGINLLRSSAIRTTLAKYALQARPRKLERFVELLGCENSVESVLSFLITHSYRPSTRFSFEFCHLTNIPQTFASASVSDDRPRFEVTRAAVPIPPLLKFQANVHDGLLDIIQDENGRSLVVMPTGSGKTRTTVEAVIDSIVANSIPHHGIVWLADRDELCEQAIATFRKVAEQKCPYPLHLWRYWKGNICDVEETPEGQFIPGIVVTSVQQLRRRWKEGDATARTIVDTSEVFIVDEAHRNLDWIQDLNNHLLMNERQSVLIGLSATPFRRMDAESGRLAEIFSWNALTPFEGGEENPESVINTLVEMEILAKRNDMTPSDLGINQSGIAETGQLKICIETIKKLLSTGHKSVIVFTPNVEWANLGSSALSLLDNGIVAESLSSETPPMVRRNIIESFRKGECQVLLNCEILTTGFDAPKTDAVVIARPAMKKHDPLFLQMVGRGLRGSKFGGTKECTVIHQIW